MTRFEGLVGYDLGQTETRPGVWEDNIVERTYFGEIKNPTRQVADRDDSTNKNVSISNIFEIMADEFADNNFHAIRYVVWKNTKWTVESIRIRRPRLVLRVGGVWNGPTAPAPGGP